jgi:hypothetical protein
MQKQINTSAAEGKVYSYVALQEAEVFSKA